MTKKGILKAALLAGLCAWGVMLYAHTLSVPFMFDDETTVLKNPVIRQLADTAFWKHPDYRKRMVPFFSFALNYRMHGFDVWGYHVVNISIHLGMALCIVWLILLLLRTPRMREEKIAKKRFLIAFLGGLFFVSHPIETQAVTYICQRSESLASLYYVLALCGYLQGRMNTGGALKTWIFFSFAIASAILGMFSKEIAFTLPFALMLIEGIFFKGPLPSSALQAEKSGSSWIVFWGEVVFLPILLAVAFWSLNLPKVFSSHAKMGISSVTYLLTQGGVVVKYLGLLFFPFPQNLDHDIAWSTGFFDGTTGLSLLIVLLLIILGFRMARRNPLVGFGILWFFLTLSVSSSIIPQKDAMMEHRLYLPSVGFMVAFLAGFYGLIKNFRWFVLGMCGVALSFSLLTYQRNALWANEVLFWEDVVRQSPDKARPYNNLGLAYRKQGTYSKAIAAYETALKLGPGKGEPLSRVYTNLGAIYGMMGRYKEEISLCQKAVTADPLNYQAYSNLGYAYALMGDNKTAFLYGRQAVKMNPRFDESWNNLGVIQARMGNYKRAEALFREALRLNPYYKEAASNLTLAREKQKPPQNSRPPKSSSIPSAIP